MNQIFAHVFFSYVIMKTCWNLEPTERPTFNKIAQMIEKLLGDQPKQEQVSWCPTRIHESRLACFLT